MKKKLLLFLILISGNILNAQDFELENKTVIGVFNVEGKSQSEIFSSINKWISLNYNSAQSVIQLNDKEAGNIIVKGINQVNYKNVMKEIYTNNSFAPEYHTAKFNHTIEINLKDNKFRIIYSITDIVESDGVGVQVRSYNLLFFDLIDFTGIKQEPIDRYNKLMEESWKNAMMGKKKRQYLQERTRFIFEALNQSLIDNIKLTMLSIEDTVKSSKKDDW